MLKEEKQSLKVKLEKTYEFMKQFVIDGINLLEKFWEWMGEREGIGKYEAHRMINAPQGWDYIFSFSINFL